MGLTVTATPLVAGRLPGVMTPVPPAKTAVSVALDPVVIDAGFAVKLVITGFTVMVTIAMTAVPAGLVTVRV